MIAKVDMSKKTKIEVDPESRSVSIDDPGGTFKNGEQAHEFVEKTLREVETRSGQPSPAEPKRNFDEERRNRILAICEQRAIDGRAPMHFDGKPVTLEEVRSMPLAVMSASDEAKTRTPDYNPPINPLRRSCPSSEDRDAAKFSIGRLIRSQFNGHAIDGVEREIIDEGASEARSAGLPGNGYMISSRAFQSYSEYQEGRSLSVTGGTGGDQGGLTVETNKHSLLGALFDSLFIARAGATVLDQLTGNLDIPRIVDGADPGHKGENEAAGEHSPTFTDLSLSPKRLPTYIDVSNQLLLQSSDATLTTIIERHLRQKLLTVMEGAFINGDGDKKPTGILQTSGIGLVEMGVDGGAPTHAALVNLIKEVAIDNALDRTAAFAINSATAAKLKTVAKIASTDSMTLLDDRAPGVLAGYPFFESNAIPGNLSKGGGTDLSAILFGTWADFYIAQWSGVEVMADPYTKRSEGMTRIHAAVYYDGGPVRPQSFAAIKDCDNS